MFPVLSVLLGMTLAGCGSSGGDGGGGARDTVTPTVSLTNPGRDATGVSSTSTISAAFSEAMDASTLTVATMTVTTAAGAVAGTVAVSGTVATFTPDGPLAAGTLHTATIRTGARDLAGNGLAAEYVWQFRTAAAGSPDTTPPVIVVRSPASGATGVAVGSAVSAGFSEAMAASTLTPATVTVTAGGQPVSGSVSVSGATAIFTPSGPLAPGTVHTVRISTGAADLAGNPLATAVVWQFTTASPWQTMAPMPTPRMDLAVVSLGGKVYALGGFSGSTLAFNEVYDPATNTWETKAPMTHARRLFVAAAVNGKIYAIGGLDFTNVNSGTYVTVTEEYDPVADAWTPKAPFPMAFPGNTVVGNSFLGGASAGGKIYVAIFNTGVAGTTATYEYDPAADSWDTAKAPVPMSYTRYSAATLNGKVATLATDAPPYWNSSFADGAPFATYDPVQDIWIVQQPTQVPRRFHTLASAAGRVLAIGGEAYAGSIQGIATFGETGAVEVFDPSSGRWTVGQVLSVARHSAGAAAIGDTVYVIGGGTSSGVPLSAVETLTIN